MAEVLNIAAVHREGLPALQIGLRTAAFDIVRDVSTNRIKFIDATSKTPLTLDGHVTTEVFSNTLKNYVTISAMNAAFNNVYSRTQIDNILNNITTSITQQLTGYYNKLEIDNKIPNITASTSAPSSTATGKPGDLWIVYE